MTPQGVFEMLNGAGDNLSLWGFARVVPAKIIAHKKRRPRVIGAAVDFVSGERDYAIN